MRGFVLRLVKAKNEDMIATVLTSTHIKAYYRFYGARHSILQLGHLIDFEVEGEDSRFMPRLRGLRHMGFRWLYERYRLMIWHDWIKLFEPHLRDTQDLDAFYYELLLHGAKHWDKQNPKRIVIESHYSLLRFEGRLHEIDRCYICEQPITETIALMPTMRPVHPECIAHPPLPRSEIEQFLTTGKSLFLSDETVDYLYGVTTKGL